MCFYTFFVNLLRWREKKRKIVNIIKNDIFSICYYRDVFLYIIYIAFCFGRRLSSFKNLIMEDKMEKIKIEYIKPVEIREYKNNPRQHKDEQIRQIANSIKQFGFNNPVLVDENCEILAGHGRLAAAKLIELEQIPIVRLVHLKEAEKRAYRIADNKLTENGLWNEDLLKLEFCEIEKLSLNLGLELSLDVTGFSLPEVDVLLDGSKKEHKSSETLNAEPYVPENEIISKSGDIWHLDQHRIICGNSLKNETLASLMSGKKQIWCCKIRRLTLKYKGMSEVAVKLNIKNLLLLPVK